MIRNTKYNVVLDHVPKTEYYKGSFSYRGGMLWNSLPNEIKASESKAIFKRKLASRQAKCWLHFTIILLFVHIFGVVVRYLLLFVYGFHVKLCNLWNYRIQIKVNQSINQSICLSVCLPVCLPVCQTDCLSILTISNWLLLPTQTIPEIAGQKAFSHSPFTLQSGKLTEWPCCFRSYRATVSAACKKEKRNLKSQHHGITNFDKSN